MSGSLLNGAAQLRGAMDLLEQAWQRSEVGWDDGVRRRFEAERMQPLRDSYADATHATQRLAEVLNAARRACSDAEHPSEGF
jgi:hypothetical protein